MEFHITKLPSDRLDKGLPANTVFQSQPKALKPLRKGCLISSRRETFVPEETKDNTLPTQDT